MLSQPEGIVEDLTTESTDEVADSILDLGQLGLGLLRDLDDVELRVDVACINQYGSINKGALIISVS